MAQREIASILRCDLSLLISDYEVKLLTETFNIVITGQLTSNGNILFLSEISAILPIGMRYYI